MTKTDIVDIVIEYVEKTPDNMDLGEKIREFIHIVLDLKLSADDDTTYQDGTYESTIEGETYTYESSDGGNTVYRKESGKDERVLVKKD